MSKAANTSKKSLTDLLSMLLDFVNRYAVLLFLIFLTAVYGFVAFRVIMSRNAQPSEAAVSAQEQASPTPHIDAGIVNQMQSLQDHSVSVKALFDQARNNPFHE